MGYDGKYTSAQIDAIIDQLIGGAKGYYRHRYGGEEIDAMCDILNGGAIGGQIGSVEIQGAVNASQAARDAAEDAAREAVTAETNAKAAAETATQAATVAAEKAAENVIQAEESRVTAESQRQANEATRQEQEAQRQASAVAMNVWEAYDPTKDYVPNNKVSCNGSSYACTVACRGIMPPDDRCWVLIAAQGGKGEQGDTGNIGGKGDKGDKGDRGDSGITETVNGFYTLYVNEAGHLIARYPDGADAPALSLRNGHLILTI